MVVPESVLAAVRALVDQASDAVIAAQAAECPQLLTGGFQAVPRNAVRFRVRLKEPVRSPLALPEWVRFILAELDLTGPLIAVLRRRPYAGP